MREVRMALLEADVNYKVVKDFVGKVKERAIGQNILETLTPAQAVIKIVDDELTTLMGGTQSRIAMASQPPTIIMMTGLQGDGKTTSAGKLGLYVLVTGNDEISMQVTVTAQNVPKGEKVPRGTTITLEFTDTAARD